MTNTITLKELRPSLPKVISRIDGKMDRYVVTRRGKPVAVMLSPDDYESLIETLDILSDKKAVVRIRKGEAEARRGLARPWKDVKKELARI